jgi:hypothetical protein
MSFISKLFKAKERDYKTDSDSSTEEFLTLVRVYYQGVMAVNLGVTNLNILNDMALFKRMLKIATLNNKLGLAEKARARKILMQDYGIGEDFFKEIDASVKKCCRTQNDIKTYFLQFQGFNSSLFELLGNLMQIKFRISLLFKNMLHKETGKLIHKIMTQSEWKNVDDQKKAWAVKKYAENLHYSENWISEFVYHVMLLAKEDRRRDLVNKDKKGGK